MGNIFTVGRQDDAVVEAVEEQEISTGDNGMLYRHAVPQMAESLRHLCIHSGCETLQSGKTKPIAA